MNDKVSLFNCAVGDCDGKALIEAYSEVNIGATRLKKSNEGEIDVRSIDDLDIKDKIDFIKIDVEGFEISVIMGMKKLLKRDKPVLWIEIFDNNKRQMDTLLNRCGYRQIDRVNDSNYIFVNG